MLIEVTGCTNCPFADFQDYGNSCNAPGAEFGSLSIDYISYKKEIANKNPVNIYDFIVTPEWCPLKKEIISVCINPNIL